MANQPSEKEQELRQKYMEFQMIAQQLQQHSEQANLIQSQIQQLQNLKASLGELKQEKASTEAFTPVGSGVFVKSKLGSTDSVLISVGAKTFVEKSIGDAQVTIDKQINLTKEYSDQIMTEMQILEHRAQHLQQELA